MSTHAHDVLAPSPPRSLEVHVTCDPEGGWRINALRDGRVVREIDRRQIGTEEELHRAVQGG